MRTHPLKIVLLGGGTGSFTLLQGLKKLSQDVTAIVSMSDDGGSTGVLRDELGVLPPGDVRQCLVALSDSPKVRNLFSYRFSDGRFEGQSLGNIILSGLELQYGNFEKAVQVASEVLNITGKVVPVTTERHQLVMQDGSETVKGQSVIDTRAFLNADARLWLEPEASINPIADEAIRSADLVVIAPGSLHTSLLPILLVGGVPEALRKSRATVVVVANLVNKPGQTDNWHVVDYVQKYESLVGQGVLDVVLYNMAHISEDLLKHYAAEGEFPVSTDSKRFRAAKVRMVGADLLAKELARQDPADKAIRRTLIRHDANKVRAELQKILRRRALHLP